MHPPFKKLIAKLLQPDVNFTEAGNFTAHLNRQASGLVDKYIKISFQPQKGKGFRRLAIGDQRARLKGYSEGVDRSFPPDLFTLQPFKVVHLQLPGPTGAYRNPM